MAERTYTPYERELAVWAAERDGDKIAAEIFECSEATIRSWRHRAERQVTDLRASRDDDGAGDSAEGAPAVNDLADVRIAIDDWDGGLGCYRKIPARARVLEKFQIGSAFVSRGELRTLNAPGTAGLALGDLVLLGGPSYAEFGDALWAVAERRDGELLVRPAKLRRGEQLSKDGSRIVAKGAPPPPGHKSWADYERTRERNRAERDARNERFLREQRELVARQLANDQ